MLIFAANAEQRREEVKAYLRARKSADPGFCVVDIGGSANPWCDELVDYYVDIAGDGPRLIKGDIQSLSTWEKIRAVSPNFCICTHTLEDIRDPGWVMSRISETFCAGFISMPNKHQECSRGMESWFFPGWCHHRWIFSLGDDGVLRALAKLPIVVCFSPFHSVLGRLLCARVLSKVCRKLRFFPMPTPLAWRDLRLARPGFELAILFEDKLPFEYINGDFAGANQESLIVLYQKQLERGL